MRHLIFGLVGFCLVTFFGCRESGSAYQDNNVTGNRDEKNVSLPDPADDEDDNDANPIVVKEGISLPVAPLPEVSPYPYQIALIRGGSGGPNHRCGNGVREHVEKCDDGGETAKCDADCTLVECGDGVINEAAGETCEEGGADTKTCDDDCTAVKCGDGVINEAAGEACEEGGVETKTCDADCTAVTCGDGTMNEAAGEECEPDSIENGGACTASCARALRAFLTSTTSSGDIVGKANELSATHDLVDEFSCSVGTFGGGDFDDGDGDSGVEAADCLCRERAAMENLLCNGGGFACWKAWIADSSDASLPTNRFMFPQSDPSLQILQIDEEGNADPTVPIAQFGFNDLLDCLEADEINSFSCLDDPQIMGNGWLTEDGNTRISALTWTGVNQEDLAATHTLSTVDDAHCVNWTSNDGAVNAGWEGDANNRGICWTGGTAQNSDGTSSEGCSTIEGCNNQRHLYCFEDP